MASVVSTKPAASFPGHGMSCIRRDIMRLAMLSLTLLLQPLPCVDTDAHLQSHRSGAPWDASHADQSALIFRHA